MYYIQRTNLNFEGEININSGNNLCQFNSLSYPQTSKGWKTTKDRSFVKHALVASAVPWAPTMGRTQLALTPSHNRMAPSLDAVTYMPPVEEYLTCT